MRVAEDGCGDVVDEAFRLRYSNDYVVLEDHWVPLWVEVTTGTHPADTAPEVFARVEVRRGRPELVELRYSSGPDKREVRQTDLRNTQVTAIVEDLLAGLTFRVERDEGGEVIVSIPTPGTEVHVEARRRIERARAGTATRTITPELLQRVADLYRQHVNDKPTQAVQRAFMVSPRMASEYVQRARRAGLLPPTTPGRKQA